MTDVKELYEKLQDLRQQVQEKATAMAYYNRLKEFNYNDKLYGWVFANDAILKDTLEDLDLYQDAYVRDVLRIYISELETILYKVNL